MSFTFDEDILSDLHKDARGFRPRMDFWGHWRASSSEEKQAIWDGLVVELEQSIAEENAAKAKAWADLEARVADLMSHGANDEQTALRWIVDSLNPSEQDLWYGGEWVCWSLGLGFDRAYVFNKACKELLDGMKRVA